MSPARFRIHLAKAGLAFVAFVVIIIVMSLSGCGRTPLEHSVETAGMVHIAHGGVVEVMRASVQDELEEQCGDIADELERRACADGVINQAGNQDAETALRASAESIDSLTFALRSWIRQVEAGQVADDEPPFAVCEALSRMTALVEAWVEVGGATLPLEPWTCPDYQPEGADQ